LGEDDNRKPETKGYRLKWLPEVVRDTRAEGISQGGKQEVERAGESDQFTISDFERITEER